MSWLEGVEDEGLKETLSTYESQEQFFEKIGYKPPEPEKIEVVKDWREGLDEDLRKTADRFNSEADMIRAIENYRKKDSLVRVPGKDATPEEISAYNKAIGVPEDIKGYEFPDTEDEQLKANQEKWAQRFMDHKIPASTAKALLEAVSEDREAYINSQIESDKEFVKASQEALQAEWKGDFEKNKTFANRAFAEIAKRSGQSLEDLTSMETKDGRLLMDHPEMLKLFAVIGREMGEGSLGPVDVDPDTIQDELRSLRKDIQQAQDEGDSKRANQLYQKEQSLLSKLGNQPVVGSHGRAA